MRRDLATILAAHDLDPDRCDLFVEGSGDRHFLEWLAGDRKHPKASITEIDSVCITGVQGGNRGRLIALASQVPGSVRIVAFADADFDRLFSKPVPDNVWLTDYRDREGYLQTVASIEKLWRLSLGSSVDANAVLQSILCAGRQLGCLRISATNLALDLPFQGLKIHRRVRVRGNMVDLDIQACARALCHRAGVAARTPELIEEWANVVSTDPQPMHDVIHGKDFLAILGELLAARGVDRKLAAGLVWATAERDALLRHPALSRVLGFLETMSL